MIPDADKLGAYVRYLRDHGIVDAIGDCRNVDGERQFGVRVGGSFYSVSELQSELNREAVLARNFAAVYVNRGRLGIRTDVRSSSDRRTFS